MKLVGTANFARRLRLAGGLVWVAASAVGLGVCTAPVAVQAQEAAKPASLPFTRSLKGTDGQVSAVQTAIRRFVPKDSAQPTVYLVAVTHIGEKAYYDEIQKVLDRQDLVLFEGVKAGRDEATKPADVQQADGEKMRLLQRKLSKTLGVEFQLDAIQYKRKNFRNSDLSWDDLMAAAQKSGTQSTTELSQLKATMSGDSADSGPTGAMVNSLVDTLGTNPAMMQMFRRVLVTTLADPEALTRMQKQLGQAPVGAPARPSPLLSSGTMDGVLIQARNRAVIQDLKNAEPRLRPGASVALFYGAGHMADMQRRLINELGYHASDVQWLTALTVAAPAKAAAPSAAPPSKTKAAGE